MTEEGRHFAYRERAHTPGDPVRPVELVKEGPPRSQKVKVRRLDGEYEGLEEWVPKVRLVVPWDEQEALLEDERRMFAALEASGDVSGNLDLSRSWWTDNEAFRERAEARLEELRPIFAIVRGGAGKGPKRSSAR